MELKPKKSNMLGTKSIFKSYFIFHLSPILTFCTVWLMKLCAMENSKHWPLVSVFHDFPFSFFVFPLSERRLSASVMSGFPLPPIYSYPLTLSMLNSILVFGTSTGVLWLLTDVLVQFNLVDGSSCHCFLLSFSF